MLHTIIVTIIFLILITDSAYAGGDWGKVHITGFKIINSDQSAFEITIQPVKDEKISIFPGACDNIVIHVSYSRIYSYFNFPDFITFEKNTDAAADLKNSMINGTVINFGPMGAGLVYDEQKPCTAYSKALWKSSDTEQGTTTIMSFYHPV